MGYNLIITEKADEHIDSLAGYLLAKLKNPQAAGNFLSEIEGIYDRLEDNPYQFPISSDKYLALKDYREAHFQKMSYKIVFRIEDKVVYVVGVFHDLEDYAKKVL
ncbi:MAG: type II toxin-antitoxin system RelE/ParE family toxin [Lachnospiraceae bacterium]|nr:type II toxin-antitoxin system RelE/ParE family toxin [Lachnospiraceae bacterium]